MLPRMSEFVEEDSSAFVIGRHIGNEDAEFVRDAEAEASLLSSINVPPDHLHAVRHRSDFNDQH